MQKVDFDFEGLKVHLQTHDAPDLLYNRLERSKNFYEIDLLLAIRRIYPQGSLIVDAGANIGNHTVFFSRVIGAPVLAFEPFKKNLEILQLNVENNDCASMVQIMPYALGDEPGRGSSEIKVAGNRGNVTINATSDGDIEIVRLDDVIKDDRRIGVIKIDVEGFEQAVIGGAKRVINEYKPHMFIEAHSSEEKAALDEILVPLGYKSVARYCVSPTYHYLYEK